ncbi:cytoskeleton protein RodZ [Streptococcus infantis]|uniref:cytoskeleton protein RodZ n=1 Tax=Streptococcus infantis TaxID=68892 RepID=UPI001BDB57E3|nr:cytoskeleton protein RodZ [Streptococcus infantis]MBT0951937.1 helix-turn-helix domain-containing protein [Streptococcus infantis]
MRKKTIGEVLRLARINQGLSLEELQRKTDIQLDMLEALESDDFDKLPSPFYARSFLRKYAWAVELDENIVLDAYDSGSMITYEEVDVDEIELTGRRRSNRKKRSLLPLFYFVLFSLSILIFVTCYVWNYIQTQPTETTSANYNIVTTTTNAPSSETTSSNQTTNPSSSTEASTVTVTGQGDVISVEYKTPKETAELQLSVTDATSWVSVSDTDLAGGATLDPNNKTVKTTISKGSPVTITLGVVKGVKIKIDNQEIDTSKLTGQTGWITMNLSSN